MKAGFGLFVMFAMVAGVVACNSSQIKTAETPKVAKAEPVQEVEFTEDEVPYIQAVKKDGKMSAVIVYSKDVLKK